MVLGPSFADPGTRTVLESPAPLPRPSDTSVPWAWSTNSLIYLVYFPETIMNNREPATPTQALAYLLRSHIFCLCAAVLLSTLASSVDTSPWGWGLAQLSAHLCMIDIAAFGFTCFWTLHKGRDVPRRPWDVSGAPLCVWAQGLACLWATRRCGSFSLQRGIYLPVAP